MELHTDQAQSPAGILPPEIKDKLVAMGPVAAAARDLLESGEIAQRLPEPREQGQYITDRVIGDVVAAEQQGAFVGKPESTAEAVLRGVQLLHGTSLDPEDFMSKVGQITQARGVRGAVALLADDDRTAGFLATAAAAIEKDEQGRVTLTSLGQVEGYLYGMADGGPRSWQQPIIAELARYATAPDDQKQARWRDENSRLLGADNRYIRGEQQAWDEAVRAAREDGVDMSLVVRSAEQIRAERHDPQTLGAAAVGSVVPRPNFDRLLQP